MTEDRLPLAELMQKTGGDDFLRAVAEAVVQLLLENDVEGLIGAGRHERSAERQTYRNGFRDRALDTRLGLLPAPFMDASEHDVLAYMGFPAQHRQKLHSTNIIERYRQPLGQGALRFNRLSEAQPWRDDMIWLEADG